VTKRELLTAAATSRNILQTTDTQLEISLRICKRD